MPSARFGGFAFGWEVGLLVVMVLLYVLGTSINPRFFGDLTALQSVLRDAARYGVMAVGMTFVIVNRDLDLSVGSTLGLVAVVFSIAFAPTHFDLPAWAAVADLPRRRARGRADQRRAGHLAQGAGVHRHAHHAVRRPRPRARA